MDDRGCEAKLKQARAETLAAFVNRARLYYHVLDELTVEIGRDRATALMKAAIRRRGEEVAEKYRPAAERGDLEEVARLFCETSPSEGALFRPGVEECDEDALVLRMERCPLVEVWREMGLGSDEVDRLCEVAAAVDEGTFEGAGLDLVFLERQGQPGAARCLLRLTRRSLETPSWRYPSRVL